MKKNKRLVILLGLLVLACAATFALTHYEKKQEKIKNSDEIILEIPTDSVQTLAWEYEDTALSFHRDETWIYDDDEAFPVDDGKISQMLEQFEAFGVSFIIEEVEDYGQYGLDTPICTITFTTEEETYAVKLGNFSNMDQKRYVDIGDGNVYLVSNDPLEQFDAVLSDVIDHDEMPDFDQVTAISFTGTENYSVTYEEESTKSYSAEDVYFTQDGQPLDTALVEDYLDTISSLNATDYVTYNATEEELASFGLDEPELTVTVDYTYENEEEEEVSETFVLNISRDPEEVAAAEESEEEDDEITAYIRVGESQIVYRVTAKEQEALRKVSYNDLRHQEVFWADFEDVYQIDITLEEKEHTLTCEEADDERVWYYQEEATPEAEEETTGETTEEPAAEDRESLDLSALQKALEDLTAASFTSEKAGDKEEIRLTVYLDNEHFPKVQIALYRYNGSDCLAVVDGKTVSLVSRSSVMDLVEAVQAMVLN